MIKGYKCFYKGLITNFHNQLEVNKLYHANENITFSKNGFHLCQNLEDTLRYFNTFKEEVDIALVEGYGKIHQYDDEYYGFYDMYAVEHLKIIKVLSHDEIINYVLKLPEYRIERFISLYKLEKNDIALFKKIFYNKNDIIKAIMYYQEGITDVYEKDIKIKIKR